MKTTLLGLIAVLAMASTASAHPGHFFATSLGWAHYLTGPYHLFLGLVVALCVGAISRVTLQRLRLTGSVKPRS